VKKTINIYVTSYCNSVQHYWRRTLQGLLLLSAQKHQVINMYKLFTIIASIAFLNVSAQIKPTPANERLKNETIRKQLQEKSLVNHIPFRNIGPSVMSGRVVDIEVNEKDPTEFYVAYATGGLWYTKNNGQSFAPIFDSADIIGIGDIAVNWKSHTIWVGTGEVNSSRSSYAGIGMYKSTDTGKHWTYVGLPESHHIGKIQLHPTDENTVWVGVLGHLYSANKERGVYKTTDGGKTWKQTLYIDENTGVVDIDINPKNLNEMFAAAWYRTRRAWNFEEGGATSGLYKSNDGGETWQLISKEGSGFPTGNGVGRIGIAVAASKSNIIYAVVDNQNHQPDTAKKKTDSTKYLLKDFKDLTKEIFASLDNKKIDTFFKKNGIPKKYTAVSVKEMVANDKLKPTCIWDYLFDANTSLIETPIIGCEVYRSDDYGLTWKKTNSKALRLYNTYGYYFGKIFVSAANENKVVITGYDIELSTDAGKTFKKIDKENVHADHHFAWINTAKDSHMIIGNDGGCNITYDDGAHWFKANTPAVGQFYAVTVDMAKPYNVYGGLQDNGTWFGSSKSKENFAWFENGHYPFKSLSGGDGMQVQVDWRDNTTVYSGYQFGNYARSSTSKNAHLSEPEGETSEADVADEDDDDDDTSIHPKNDLGEAPLRYNWQTPILLSRHNQDVLYFGSNKFHRSLKKGMNMETLSDDLTTNPTQGDVPFGSLTTIAESPLKFGLLYTGSDDGNLQVSKDGGYTWNNISKNLPKHIRGLYVSRVTSSIFKESRVYATVNGYRNDHFGSYVFMSDDFGINWKQIAKDLPAEPVNVIIEDIKYDSILYIGTDGGLYVSIDAGNTVMQWNKNMPKSIPVHDLVIQSRDNEIIVGTHGRSIYIAALDNVQKLLKNPTYKEKVVKDKSEIIENPEKKINE
jgi:photosystem II stability/assembly factor-like uncharacterized protein